MKTLCVFRNVQCKIDIHGTKIWLNNNGEVHRVYGPAKEYKNHSVGRGLGSSDPGVCRCVHGADRGQVGRSHDSVPKGVCVWERERKRERYIVAKGV